MRDAHWELVRFTAKVACPARRQAGGHGPMQVILDGTGDVARTALIRTHFEHSYLKSGSLVPINALLTGRRAVPILGAAENILKGATHRQCT
jgi:hypothetical protein